MPVIKPSLRDAAQARAAVAALEGGAAVSVGEVALPANAIDAVRDLLEQLATGEALLYDVRGFVPDADRPKCAGCREPIELADPDDGESWIHAEDANYFGDHTAWIEQATG